VAHFVHFNPATGEIVGWESTDVAPPAVAGHEVLEVESIDGVGHKTHKVHVKRRAVAAKTKKELSAARETTIFKVKQIVFAELQASDVTQIPDYPISQDLRAKWTSYRQALRDLSKNNGTARAMLDAFPARPDGVDVKARYAAMIGPPQ